MEIEVTTTELEMLSPGSSNLNHRPETMSG
jgi:hypothetical protein